MPYPPAHQHLRFDTVVKTFSLVEKPHGTDTVTVTCAVEESNGQYDSLKYTTTLKLAAAKQKTYSLVTLGVQAIDREVIVYSAEATTQGQPSGTPVTFGGPGDSDCTRQIDKTNPPKGLVLTRAGVAAQAKNPALQTVNKNGIWFVSFTGDTCVLQFEMANVKTKEARIGKTVWKSGAYSDGHDNTPPPEPI